jgi:hypothetical protein
VNPNDCSHTVMLTNALQFAVLAQCTTIYLAVAHFHMGSTHEDYVVTEYESWMEVRLAVSNNLVDLFAQLTAGAVYQSNTVHPRHGLDQMLDNVVPPKSGSEQEAHGCFNRPCRLECSLDCWFVPFYRFAWKSPCAVGRCRGSGKTAPTR